MSAGFGPKASTNPYEPITCFLAKVTRRPVRLVLDREQVFWHNRARHKHVHEMKTAVDKDGYLLGLEHLSVLDGGRTAVSGNYRLLQWVPFDGPVPAACHEI